MNQLHLKGAYSDNAVGNMQAATGGMVSRQDGDAGCSVRRRSARRAKESLSLRDLPSLHPISASFIQLRRQNDLPFCPQHAERDFGAVYRMA